MPDPDMPYGEWTIPGVVFPGGPDNPDLFAYIRDHPDSIVVPAMVKFERRLNAAPERRRRLPGEMTQLKAAWSDVPIPSPDSLPPVEEILAFMRQASAQARQDQARQDQARQNAVWRPGQIEDPLLVPVQSRRGGGGPTRMPGGGFADLTPREVFLLARYDAGMAELRRLEPNNPYTQTLRPQNTPPTLREVEQIEIELNAARLRKAYGEVPRGSPPPSGAAKRMVFDDWDKPRATERPEAVQPPQTQSRIPALPTTAQLAAAAEQPDRGGLTSSRSGPCEARWPSRQRLPLTDGQSVGDQPTRYGDRECDTQRSRRDKDIPNAPQIWAGGRCPVG